MPSVETINVHVGSQQYRGKRARSIKLEAAEVFKALQQDPKLFMKWLTDVMPTYEVRRG